MKHLAAALVAGVFFSGVALAQQSIVRPGDPDPYASRPGAPNPYATRGGDPNPYATRGGDPAASGADSHRDNDRHSTRKERGVRASEKVDKEQHLPYGSGGGTQRR